MKKESNMELLRNDPYSISVSFREPIIISKKYRYSRKNKITAIELKLDRGMSVIGTQSVFKKGNKYCWHDDLVKITRTFDSIDNLMWEFALPKSLKEDFLKL